MRAAPAVLGRDGTGREGLIRFSRILIARCVPRRHFPASIGEPFPSQPAHHLDGPPARADRPLFVVDAARTTDGLRRAGASPAAPAHAGVRLHPARRRSTLRLVARRTSAARPRRRRPACRHTDNGPRPPEHNRIPCRPLRCGLAPAQQPYACLRPSGATAGPRRTPDAAPRGSALIVFPAPAETGRLLRVAAEAEHRDCADADRGMESRRRRHPDEDEAADVGRARTALGPQEQPEQIPMRNFSVQRHRERPAWLTVGRPGPPAPPARGHRSWSACLAAAPADGVARRAPRPESRP